MYLHPKKLDMNEVNNEPSNCNYRTECFAKLAVNDSPAEGPGDRIRLHNGNYPESINLQRSGAARSNNKAPRRRKRRPDKNRARERRKIRETRENKRPVRSQRATSLFPLSERYTSAPAGRGAPAADARFLDFIRRRARQGAITASARSRVTPRSVHPGSGNRCARRSPHERASATRGHPPFRDWGRQGTCARPEKPSKNFTLPSGPRSLFQVPPPLPDSRRSRARDNARRVRPFVAFAKCVIGWYFIVLCNTRVWSTRFSD